MKKTAKTNTESAKENQQLTPRRDLSALFSSASEEWATPQALFNSLNEEFHFNLDVCATQQNAKCERYFDKSQDGLAQVWDGVVWCNPPYGKTIQKWIEKGYESTQIGEAQLVVMLLPARTDTKYWHEFVWDGSQHKPKEGVEVRLMQGRVRFGEAKSSAPFPSAVVIFRSTKNEPVAVIDAQKLEAQQTSFFTRLRNKFLSLQKIA